MKKAILIAIPVLLIVYVLFVCVPYTGQGAATEETKENFHIEEFYNDAESGERAKILFTNEEALKERLSLIANARERIVLSTFDLKRITAENGCYPLFMMPRKEACRWRF